MHFRCGCICKCGGYGGGNWKSVGNYDKNVNQTYGVFVDSKISFLTLEQSKKKAKSIRFDIFYFIIKMLLDLLRFPCRLCANKKEDRKNRAAHILRSQCLLRTKIELFGNKRTPPTHTRTHTRIYTQQVMCAHVTQRSEDFMWHSFGETGVRVMVWQMGIYFNSNGITKQHPFPLCAGVPFNKLHRRNLHFVLAVHIESVKTEESILSRSSCSSKAFTKMKFNRHLRAYSHLPPYASVPSIFHHFSSNFSWHVSNEMKFDISAQTSNECRMGRKKYEWIKSRTCSSNSSVKINF